MTTSSATGNAGGSESRGPTSPVTRMYDRSLSHPDDSNSCAGRIIGIDISTRMVAILHQGKARIKRILDSTPPETRTAHESTCCVPHDIVEMILAHLIRDLGTLKACSLTCRFWYIITLPHLFCTLTLRRDRSSPISEKLGMKSPRDRLKPLYRLHERGLTPLVKGIRVVQLYPWFIPEAFSHRDLRYFSAFTNVQTLVFHELRIDRFILDIECYFGHFSPTLRSITLYHPRCTPRQLSHFLSIFSTLDDIAIIGNPIEARIAIAPDIELIPLSTPKLRGRLLLTSFSQIDVWTRLIALCGGLRFRYMYPAWIGDCAPVLFEACAETLEILRISAADDIVSMWLCGGLSPDSS